MKEITVIGSCVCRDLFEEDNGKNYSFQTDIRFSSPISMLSEPVDFVLAQQDNFGKKVDIVGTNWYKKNLINDINKKAFDALEKKHGEYLILDLAESRLPLANLHWKKNDKTLLVTNSVSFRGHYKINLSKNIFKGTTFDVISPLHFSDFFWEKTIKEFANRLKKIFKEEKIILIRTKPARHYVDTKGFLHPYSSPNHFNEILLCDLLLDKLNVFFLKYCSNCQVIDFPSDAIGYQAHKWGNHPFHFTSVYYEYLLNCVNNIILNGNRHSLKMIKSIFEKRFSVEREKYILNNAKSYELTNDIDYIELLNRYEEFCLLGKKKKIEILFALDKKHLLKHLKYVFNKN